MSAPAAVDFYDRLPELTTLDDAFIYSNFVDAPSDWLIVLTDVMGSTEAIASGRYKEVNMAGAVGITAISNLFGHLRFPYVFGGDGVTMLIPPDRATEVLSVLTDVADIVSKSYGLTLRVGATSIRELTTHGGPVRVAKVRLTPRYTQACLDGAGLQYAEQLLKAGRIDASTEITVRADTAGFSCRWKEMPSAAGQIIALIVQARGKSALESERILRQVARTIDRFAGDSSVRNPIRADAHEPLKARVELNREASIHARGRGPLRRLFWRLSIRMQILFVRLVIALQIPIVMVGKDLKNIPTDDVGNADFQKVDGGLKTVFASSPEATDRLLSTLAEMERRGHIYFGSHISDRAMMTCVIHSKAPEEVHFVDASDGGYAEAARVLKAKILAV
ncbi:MAG: DUF3095 family protein [Spirochaetota bacterium]